MSSVAEEDEIEASRAPLLEHLTELRNRLIICVATLLIAIPICYYFSEPLFEILIRPYKVGAGLVVLQERFGHALSLEPLKALLGLAPLPPPAEPLSLISTGPLEIFWVKLKISAIAGVAITFPVLAWQLYRFVAPGLYKKERKAFAPFLIASPFLFALGAALVYYVIMPFLIVFSLSQTISAEAGSVGVEAMYKASEFFSLMAALLFAFGLSFQLPIVLTLLGLSGIVSVNALKSGRRFAIVGMGVLSAVVTPADPLSMLMLLVPLIGLYEVSIWCVALIELRRAKEDKAAGTDLAKV